MFAPIRIVYRLKPLLFFLTLLLAAGCNRAAEPTPISSFALPTSLAEPAVELPPTPTALPISTPNEASRAASFPDGFLTKLQPQARGFDYGYVDLTGEWVIEPQFEDALEFADSLAAVRLEGRYGYIDQTGQMVIPPQFEAALNFSEGLASVMIEQQWGYIDPGGTIVIEPQFDYADSFTEGLAYFISDGLSGYLETTGQIVIEPQPYDYVLPFSEGLAAFGQNGRSGFIDKSGQIVVEPQFSYVDNFSEGLALVERDGRSGYIDQSGQMVIEPRFDFAENFSEGLAVVVVDGLAGFIDRTGQTVIEPQFVAAFEFSEGLAAVLVDELWGYIDPTGKMIIEPQFAWAGNFEEDLAHVAFDENRSVYIDRTGQVIVEVKPPEVVTIETEIRLSPDQVTFTVDPALVTEVSGNIVPGETTLHPDIPFFALVPEHIAFIFDRPNASQDAIPNLQPRLLIYPIADFEKISPFAAEQIEVLKSLLAERPLDIPHEIPVLPPIDAAQIFYAQLAYLDFERGSGVRFVTYYAQEPRPISNAEIFYTFQGITHDGQHYVSFYFPVSTFILPETVEDFLAVTDYGAFLETLDTYLPETVYSLDTLAPGDYTPNLTVLDRTIRSIQVPPVSE